ncbi:hypothetical protein DL764_000765 [Monosporascus ibericus]|uniref:Uncharacterized protein n=1 Tax=Monosporascus ibericus TaxID=155417 RepID=A0A4Q4TXC9_9PEZI|nr:hypothetical protein DL764_000765 [Monosporascus ibericus]
MFEMASSLTEVYPLDAWTVGHDFQAQALDQTKKYMGQIETWDRAEDKPRQSLGELAASANGISWILNAGDVAFYRPKIDITIVDCLNRD